MSQGGSQGHAGTRRGKVRDGALRIVSMGREREGRKEGLQRSDTWCFSVKFAYNIAC